MVQLLPSSSAAGGSTVSGLRVFRLGKLEVLESAPQPLQLILHQRDRKVHEDPVVLDDAEI